MQLTTKDPNTQPNHVLGIIKELVAIILFFLFFCSCLPVISCNRVDKLTT